MTTHHNDKKQSCRTCGVKRDSAARPSPTAEAQDDATPPKKGKGKGKQPGPLTLSSGAPALDWLAGLPGNTRYQPLSSTETLVTALPADGTGVPVEMDEDFIMPSEEAGEGRVESLERVLSLLKEEPVCPEMTALIARKETELLALRAQTAADGDPSPLPPAARESAAAKVQKMLANTRTIHSQFLAKQARLIKSKSDEVARLNAELETLRTEEEHTVREFNHQIAYLETSLGTVTPTALPRATAAASPEAASGPALGALTSTNVAPLLQRGIDQLMASDQRVGTNTVFARELLGAFATLVTNGVAEYNGEQNNGHAPAPPSPATMLETLVPGASGVAANRSGGDPSEFASLGQ